MPGLPPDLCLPPDAQPVLLAPDALPAPLADALRWLPLLQGARWTYERTVAYNGAHWQRQTLTVTVAARWLLADDALLIHLASTVSGQRASLPHPWADVALGNLWSYGTDPAWLILLQDATFAVEHCADADRLTSLQERRAQLKAIVTAEASQNLQGLGVWHLLLGPRAQGDDTVAALWRLAAEPDLPSLVSLPAGALTSCRRYGNGDTHRFRSQGLLCPNLGWAAQMTSQGASAWARTITDILTAYHIPQGRPTP